MGAAEVLEPKNRTSDHRKPSQGNGRFDETLERKNLKPWLVAVWAGSFRIS